MTQAAANWHLVVVGWVNIATLVVTAGILIRYTIETSRLRREAQRQTELQVSPLLTITYEPSDRRLLVYNIGRGVALDVRVRPTRLSEPEETHPVFVEWERIDVINVDGQRELRGHATQDDEPASDAQRAWASNFGPHGRRSYEVVLAYRDITRKTHVARIRIERGVAELLS